MNDSSEAIPEYRLRACRKWPCILVIAKVKDPSEICGELWEKTEYSGMTVRCTLLSPRDAHQDSEHLFLLSGAPSGAELEKVTIKAGEFKKTYSPSSPK